MKPGRLVSPWSAVICAAGLSLPAFGCGFVFSHAPPPGHERMEYFTCTESDAGPILDIVWAGLNVAGAVAAAADPDAYEDPGQIVAVGVGWGVLSTAAAVTGFRKSQRCRLARQQLAERQAQRTLVPAGAALVQTVIITPSADTLTVGERVQLLASAHSSNGAVVPDRAFTWSSSNDAVASVSSAGLVTAHATGTVVIAANTGGVVGTASIVVAAGPGK